MRVLTNQVSALGLLPGDGAVGRVDDAAARVLAPKQ